MKSQIAPELLIQDWLNYDQTITLSENVKKGKASVIYAFQMLCPACVSHSLPQAKLVREMFSEEDLMVIGLHTVFEHHEAMGPVSLKAFLHENRIAFPVGIDLPNPNQVSPIPQTMQAYNMQGTPTLILVDRQGYLRKQIFGHVHDLQLGAEIMALIK